MHRESKIETSLFDFPTQSTFTIGAHRAEVLRHSLAGDLEICTARLPHSKFSCEPSLLFGYRIQIGLVTEGTLTLRLPDEEKVTLKSGDWFLSLNTELRLLNEYEDETTFVWAECNRKTWDALQERECFRIGAASQLPVFRHGSSQQSTTEKARTIASTTPRSSYDLLMLHSRALEFLARILEQARVVEPESAEQGADPILQAARILERNLSANHSIKQLSRQVHLNEFKLKRGFRERFNTTVFGYLRQKRMERARELILHGQPCIQSVAKTIGYANPSHFARAFKAAFGQNPKEIKKLQNGAVPVHESGYAER